MDVRSRRGRRYAEEVLFERGPFLGCGLPVLTDVDSQGASSLDELLMGADHMVGKDGGVTTRGLEAEVFHMWVKRTSR
jgi:hypothetical protein